MSTTRGRDTWFLSLSYDLAASAVNFVQKPARVGFWPTETFTVSVFSERRRKIRYIYIQTRERGTTARAPRRPQRGSANAHNYYMKCHDGLLFMCCNCIDNIITSMCAGIIVKKAWPARVLFLVLRAEKIMGGVQLLLFPPVRVYATITVFFFFWPLGDTSNSSSCVDRFGTTLKLYLHKEAATYLKTSLGDESATIIAQSRRFRYFKYQKNNYLVVYYLLVPL